MTIEMSEEGDRRRRRANGSASGSEDDEAAQAKPGSPEANGTTPSQNEDPVRQNKRFTTFATQSHTHRSQCSYGGGGIMFLRYISMSQILPFPREY